MLIDLTRTPPQIQANEFPEELVFDLDGGDGQYGVIQRPNGERLPVEYLGGPERVSRIPLLLPGVVTGLYTFYFGDKAFRSFTLSCPWGEPTFLLWSLRIEGFVNLSFETKRVRPAPLPPPPGTPPRFERNEVL
jgi:hypothetical protein